MLDDWTQNRNVFRLKVILLISSVVSLVLLLLSAFQENLAGEWEQYQRAYRTTLVSTAPTDQARAAAERMDIAFQQIFLPDLNRVDRCVTCHIAAEDPEQKQAQVPLRTHSGDLLEHHPMERFGCTICHEGQGRAVTSQAAHGEIEHWPTPLLRGEAVYRSCGKCHYENDLFGAEYDLYAQSSGALPSLTMAEIESSVPGERSAEQQRAIARGKQLVIEKGCLGCHAYRSRGGTLGPDITHVGDKTKHDFDFTHVHATKDHTVKSWLVAHFLKPSEVVPGTLMPDMDLSEDEASDLAEYMLSLRRKDMPAQYTPVPSTRDSDPVQGNQLFAMFCSSCHGQEGQGTSVLDPELRALADPPIQLMTPAIHNDDTLAIASNDYFRSIINSGRHDTNMISWSAGGGGLNDGEISRVVGYIRSWQKEGASVEDVLSRRGNARYGRSLFRERCVSCHGRNGEGGIGVALSSASFLAIASDQFLARTIISGRTNTAMPSWKQFSAQEVADVIAHLRSWQFTAPDREATLARLASMSGKPREQAIRTGSVLFRANCATCHGPGGEGAIGPSLNNDAFLSVVSDGYLFDAITTGRPGSAMPEWRHLSGEDVVDLIQFIRSWNDFRTEQLPDFKASGDWDRGKILFAGFCASCHGPEAEGLSGPQLRNKGFLESASDAMLRHWIANGRAGTVMRAFEKGNEGLGELSAAQIEDIISYIRRFQIEPGYAIPRPGLGIVSHGGEIYADVCASCHGPNGEGGTGSALSNPDFLRIASDGYLEATVALGRDGTGMRAMGQGMQGTVELSPDDINDVVAFIRSWEHHPPGNGVPPRYVVDADPVSGKSLFEGNCAGCHGVNGNDGWAPHLNNRDFLRAVTDGFLQATIARGRVDTPMRSFGIGGGGVAELSAAQIDDIVSYIRMWAPDGFRPVREILPAEVESEPVGDSAQMPAGSPAPTQIEGM